MSDSEDEDEIPRYSPQLVRETYTTNTVPKNPRVEYFKEIIRKNQGKNQLPLKDLEFYKSEILSQIPLAQITRKKVRDFCKASRWRVNGNEHTIFNYITDPVGNDFLPYEDLEIYLIDDFKHFSLAYNELNLPRKRFLNCHHVLFWLLKKNGFHPNEEDFKLLILPQKRAEQEKISKPSLKNIIGKKMASQSESLGSQDSSRSEDETPTTSDEEFIVSDSEMEEAEQEELEEDDIELLYESFINLREENKLIKEELAKQNNLLWEIYEELKEIKSK